MVTHHGERQSALLGPLRPFAVIDAAYDESGLARLESSDPRGRAEVTHERPPTGFTVADAWRTVRNELLHRHRRLGDLPHRA
ncbi:hypothetical protein [Kitasatospora paranensis]|uniref:Uncharacterized protein n=1 Tax=Kitasatospora paranensis TaxID=258053 RepID=A0ABW2FZK0_9ACTN